MDDPSDPPEAKRERIKAQLDSLKPPLPDWKLRDIRRLLSAHGLHIVDAKQMEIVRRAAEAQLHDVAGEPDLVECECGVVYVPGRCPVCEKDQELHIVDAKDKAVLEAMSTISLLALDIAKDAPGRMGNAVRAELARREGK